MAKDPYGNDVADPFDLAIAQGVMRSTWWSAIYAFGLAFTPGCTVPLMSFAQLPAIVAIIFIGLPMVLSTAAGINTVIRVFTMQAEHRRMLPSWQPWGALALAGVGLLFSAVPLGLFLLQLLLFSALSMFGSLF